MEEVVGRATIVLDRTAAARDDWPARRERRAPSGRFRKTRRGGARLELN